MASWPLFQDGSLLCQNRPPGLHSWVYLSQAILPCLLYSPVVSLNTKNSSLCFALSKVWLAPGLPVEPSGPSLQSYKYHTHIRLCGTEPPISPWIPLFSAQLWAVILTERPRGGQQGGRMIQQGTGCKLEQRWWRGWGLGRCC